MSEHSYEALSDQQLISYGEISVSVKSKSALDTILAGSEEIEIAAFHQPGEKVEFGWLNFTPEMGDIPKALESTTFVSPNTVRSSAFSSMHFTRDALVRLGIFTPDAIEMSRLGVDESAEINIYTQGCLIELHFTTAPNGALTGAVQLRTELGDGANEYEALMATVLTWGAVRHSLSVTSYSGPKSVEILIKPGADNECTRIIRNVYDEHIRVRSSESRTLPVLYLSDDDIELLASMYQPSEAMIRTAIGMVTAQIERQSEGTDYVGYIEFIDLAKALEVLNAS